MTEQILCTLKEMCLGETEYIKKVYLNSVPEEGTCVRVNGHNYLVIETEWDLDKNEAEITLKRGFPIETNKPGNSKSIQSVFGVRSEPVQSAETRNSPDSV